MKTIGQIACEAWWSKLHQVSHVDFDGWEYTTPTDKSLWEAAATAVVDNCGGQKMRDVFAAAVMQGILASCPDGLRCEEIPESVKTAWAGFCFGMSDAMLKAREK